jgi:hypothetical protein
MILYCSTFESSLQPVQVYESTAYSCTRTALYSCTITGRSCTTTVLVQRCIVQYSTKVTSKVKNIKLSKVVVQLHVRKYNYSTTSCTFVLSKVRKYESTFKVLSYESTTYFRKYESIIRRYSTFVQLSSQVRKYFRTFVRKYNGVQCTAVHVRCSCTSGSEHKCTVRVRVL